MFLFLTRYYLYKACLFILACLLFFSHLAAAAGPGNVDTNLQLWLHAGSGTNCATDDCDVSTWADQTIHGGDLTAPVNRTPNFQLGSLSSNFQPYIDFDHKSTGFNGDRLNGSNYNLVGNNITNQIIFVYRENTRLAGLFPDLWDWDGVSSGTRIETFGGTFYNGTNAGRSRTRTDVQKWHIGVANQNVSVPSVYIDGEDRNTGSFENFLGNGNIAIGGQGELDSDIAEIIFYNGTLHLDNDLKKINSYLALKYGITLHVSVNDYLNSAGVSVYNLVTHNKDVFGIGKDINSSLDQRISKSVNTESILTISTDTDFITPNLSHADTLTDGQYLVVGNNGLPAESRVWRAENTGNIGDVNLKFEGFGSDYNLITDADGDFSAGTTNEGNLTVNGEIELTLTDGIYFLLDRIPSDIALSNNSIVENTIDVGSFSTIDPDLGQTHSYLLIPGTGSEDNGFFTLSGTGNNRISFTNAPDYEVPTDVGDIAGNNTYSIRVQTNDEKGGVFVKNFIITVTDRDEIKPSTPVNAPDLQASSDTGDSNTDNNTNDTTPTVEIACTETGSIIQLYSDKPVDPTEVGTHSCTAIGSFPITVSMLSSGQHTLRYTETDAAGNISDFSPDLILTIDTTSPTRPEQVNLATVSDTGISDIDNKTDDTTPTLDGICTNGEVITLVIGSMMSTTNCVGGIYSFTPSLLEGTHIVTVTATDLVGNISSSSPPLTLIIDDTAPILSVSVDTSAGVDDPTLTFSALESLSGIDHYEVDYQANDGGPGTGTLTTLNSVTSPLILALDPDEVVHEVTIRVYDEAGNLETVVLRFPPIITFIAGTLISDTTIDDVAFTVRTRTGTDLSVITISGAASTGANLSCIGAGGDTVLPYAQPVNCTVTNITTTGKLTVDATDDGNGAIGKNEQTYTIDIVNPVVTFIDDVAVGPVQNDRVIIGITDKNGVATSEYKRITNASCSEVSYGLGAGTSFLSGDTIFTENTEANNGDFICVKAVDNAGNTIYQGSVNDLNIDVTPPLVPTCTTVPSMANNGTDVTTSCTGVEEGGIVTIPNMMCVPNPVTVAGTVNCTGRVGTGAGEITITNDVVTVRDSAGNINTAEDTGLTVDNIAPSNPIDIPELQVGSDTGRSDTDSITNDATPMVNIVCSEIGSTIQLYSDKPINRTEIGRHLCTAIGAFAITTSELGDGLHNLSYTETDTAGNTSGESPDLTIRIDTMAPLAPTITNVDGDTMPSYLTNSKSPDVVLSALNNTTVSIPGWTCSPAPVIGGTVTCSPDTDLLEGGNTGILPTITDAAGNSTVGAAFLIEVDTIVPTGPTINPIDETAISITGTSEPGSTITITGVSCDNTPIIANESGEWICDITTAAPLVANTMVEAIAVDESGNVSVPTTTIVDDTTDTTPSVPTVEPTDGTRVVGTGIPNHFIRIINPIGPTLLCQTSVLPDGSYNCEPLSPVPTVGTTLEVTQTNLNTNEKSPAVTTVVLDRDNSLFPPIVRPTGGDIVGGNAKPGTTVTILNPITGGILCRTMADITTGEFACDVAPNLLDGQRVNVTVSDENGNRSDPTTIVVNITNPDGDRVADIDEDKALNNGDGNGDGILDKDQNNVSSRENPVVGRPVTLEVSGARCKVINGYNILDELDQIKQDTAYNYPLGLFDFELYCTGIGQRTTVTFYFDKEYDTSQWEWRKLNRNTETYAAYSTGVVYGTANVGVDRVTTATVTVQDDNPDDEDGVLNARILDPAGPAVPLVAASNGGGSALNNYPVIFCEENGTCSDRYPVHSVGNRNHYKTYQKCINSGIADPYQCSRDWIEINNVGVCDNDTNICHSINNEESKKNIELEAILPANQEKETKTEACEVINYKRFPENRGKGVASNFFQDTLETHFYYKALIDLAEQQILHGDTYTNNARLNDTISRAEITKIITIARQDTLKKGNCTEFTHFPDVNTSVWYHDFVHNLEYQDIIHGYEDGYYRPEQNITKAELYKIMAISFDFITAKEAELNAFDRTIEWYIPYIEALQESVSVSPNIVKLPMDHEMTRGEVFKLLSTVLKKIDSQ